jgi:RNA polymerase sigma-70 factor (ECF subfamily)
MIGRILPFASVRAGAPDAPGRATAAAAPGRRAAGQPAPLSRAEAERFRQLMLPLLDQAYAFARFLARDATLAEDVVQEAFLKAYRGFADFRGGDPRAWLFAIVRTTFASVRRRATETTELDEHPEPVSEADTPETALVRQGEIAGVRAAIEALPEPFRETLVLRELEELGYRDIAQVTGVPIGTVMSRLARARGMLVVALGRQDDPS